MWDRVALAHKDVLFAAPKGFTARELTRASVSPLLYCGAAAAHCSALVCRSTLCRSTSLSRAMASTRTRRAAALPGTVGTTTRGLGAPHSMQRVYTALGGTRNSQPLRLGSSALRCATLQSSSSAAQRSSAAARPTAVCVVVSVRACDAMQAVPCFGSWADSRRVSADTTEFTRAAQHAAPTCIACNVQHARVLSA